MAKKESELEELRRQLAALQNAQSVENSDEPAPASESNEDNKE
jgi:hypothetical protein